MSVVLLTVNFLCYSSVSLVANSHPRVFSAALCLSAIPFADVPLTAVFHA